MSRFQSVLSRVLPAAGSRQRETLRSFVVAGAAMLAVVAASCDKVPLTSPTGSTITLSSSTSIVPVNGKATITATVIESAGTAVHNGTLVSFLADFGRLDPPDAYTLNGKATTTFIADGRSGSVAINALSGSATTQGSSSTSGGTTTTTPGRSITLLVGGAAAGRITARAEPAAVPQTGATVQIISSVTDTNGNPLAGAPVVFSIAAATAGGTLGNGVLSSTSAITDASGIARTTLTTNQATTVTATVATNLTAAVTANVSIGVITTPVVTVTASASPTVGVPVIFTLTPAANANPLASVTVNFGDGETRTISGFTGAVSISKTYSRADGYTVTATATDVNGVQGVSSTSILVTRASAPTITFTQTSSLTPPATTAGPPESFSITATTTATGVTISSIAVKRSNGETLYNQSGGGSFAALVNAGDILTATATDSAGNTSVSQLVVQ